MKKQKLILIVMIVLLSTALFGCEITSIEKKTQSVAPSDTVDDHVTVTVTCEVVVNKEELGENAKIEAIGILYATNDYGKGEIKDLCESDTNESAEETLEDELAESEYSNVKFEAADSEIPSIETVIADTDHNTYEYTVTLDVDRETVLNGIEYTPFIYGQNSGGERARMYGRLEGLIESLNIENASVTGISDIHYTGEPITQPNLEVAYGSYVLEEGTDYNVEYKNNTDIGTATITISGEGDYTGTIEKTFTIKNASILSFASPSLTKTYGNAAFTNAVTYEGDGEVTYKSSNEAVAKVDATGKVTIVGVGSATITVTASEGSNYTGATASYTVTVNKAASSLSFARSSLTKTYGDAAFTNAVTYNGDGEITYKSSNEAVAKVDATGKVTITGVGTAKITAEANGTNYTDAAASYTVTVKAPVLKTTTSISNTLYGYDDIKASWKKVSGASGYYVYYKKSTAKSYTKKDAKTKLYMNLANLADGAKYYVKVVPYKTINGTKYAGASKTSSAIYTLKKISTPKLSKKSSSKVTVKWTNIAGESGYQISKSTSKSKTGTVYTVKTTTGKSKVISTKRGKTYYYKVRAYRTVGSKKIYGPWSSVRSYKLR